MFPAYCNMPTMTSADVAINEAKQLTHALSNPKPAAPYQVGDETLLQLQQLSDIFTNALENKKAPTTCRMINFRGCRRHQQKNRPNMRRTRQHCRLSNLHQAHTVIPHETKHQGIPNATNKNNIPPMPYLMPTRENCSNTTH